MGVALLRRENQCAGVPTAGIANRTGGSAPDWAGQFLTFRKT